MRRKKSNFTNKTVFIGDNIDFIRGLNSRSFDLVYLDPPFNSNRNYSVPIGSKAAGAAFKDTWTLDDVDIAWHGEIAESHPDLYSIIQSTGLIHSKSMKSYLIMMSIRLLETHRLMKETASIYLHCDPTASHYLKLIMDAIFGKQNFRNEIIWYYKTGGASKRYFSKKHDVILFYSKTKDYIFNFAKIKSYLQHKYGFSSIKIEEDEKGFYTMVGMRDVWDLPALRGNQPEAIGYPTKNP